MVIVDTSVWVDVLKDASGGRRAVLRRALGDADVALTRFHQLELLQGSRDEREWELLSEYLDGQDYVEATADTWRVGARIYYDLRRQGETIRSPIDCCIAAIALTNDLLLVHRDRDFSRIGSIRPLKELWLEGW